jgi:hypothetical protein
MSWTTRIQLIVIAAVAVFIFIQHRIIVSNRSKIDDLEIKISQLKLDAKLQELQLKIDGLRVDIKTNADAIAANQAVINSLRVTVYKKYKPDPNMKASTIADGFKALQNEAP